MKTIKEFWVRSFLIRAGFYVLILIGLSLSVQEVASAEQSIVVHTVSRHFKNGDYQENNRGIGYRTDINRTKFFMTGVFRNSLNNEAVYVGAGSELMRYGRVRFSVVGAFISGYPMYPITPFVMFETSVEIGDVRIILNEIPFVVTALSVEFKF